MKSKTTSTTIKSKTRIAVDSDSVMPALFIDTAGASDAPSVDLARSLSDAVATSESLSFDISASVSDAAAAADQISVDAQDTGGTISKSLDDFTSTLETRVFAVASAAADAVSANDSVVVTLIPGLSPLGLTDIAGAAEIAALRLSRPITDTVSAIDTPTLTLSGASTDYADPTYFAEDYVGAAAPAGNYADPTYFAETYTA